MYTMDDIKFVAVDKTLYSRTMESLKFLQEENNSLTEELKTLRKKLDDRENALADQKANYKNLLKKEQKRYSDLLERYYGLRLTYETMLKANEAMIITIAKRLAKEDKEEEE